MNDTSVADMSGDVLLQNWDIYRYFLAVARAGSLSEAAKRLQESQPTVSRKLKELEASLGAQLVERTTTGATLTIAGELVLEHIQKIEREAIGITETLRDDGQKMSGKVVVTAPEGLGVAVLAGGLQKFRVLHPGIDLELRIGAGKLDLMQRAADIAFRVGDPLQTSLLGRCIGTVSFGLYAHERYLRQNPMPKSTSHLGQHQFIELAVGAGKLPQEVALEKLVPEPRRVLRTDNIQIQLNAVKDGSGIGALPGYMAPPSSNLVHILPQKFAPKVELWILMRPELRDVARVRATASFFADLAARAIRGDQ